MLLESVTIPLTNEKDIDLCLINGYQVYFGSLLYQILLSKVHETHICLTLALLALLSDKNLCDSIIMIISILRNLLLSFLYT